MVDSEQIARLFEERDVPLVGPVIEDRENERYLVFVKVTTSHDGSQTPTNYAISQAEKEAEAEIGRVSVVLINRGNEDISNSIKSFLLRRFPDEVRNVFSQISQNRASVWVEPKMATSSERSDELSASVSGLLSHFGIELASFVNTTELNLPSETACVGALRRKAPVSLEALVADLRRKGFEVPNDDWVGRILDKWRKKGLLMRKRNGNFVMTVSGLKALGSGRNRRSPDVVRALELGRRDQ